MPKYSAKTAASSTTSSNSRPKTWTIDPNPENGHTANFKEWATDPEENRAAVYTPILYADVAGDRTAGTVLGQILYWYGYTRDWRCRLGDKSRGLAKSKAEWFQECRLTEDEVDAALSILSHHHILPCAHPDGGYVQRPPLVELSYHLFAGKRTTHIKLAHGAFVETWYYVNEYLSPSTQENYIYAKKQRSIARKTVHRSTEKQSTGRR